jgi:hypothetical protein
MRNSFEGRSCSDLGTIGARLEAVFLPGGNWRPTESEDRLHRNANRRAKDDAAVGTVLPIPAGSMLPIPTATRTSENISDHTGCAKDRDYGAHHLDRHTPVKKHDSTAIFLRENVDDASWLLGVLARFVAATELDHIRHECFSAFRALEVRIQGRKKPKQWPLRTFRVSPWTYARSPWILMIECLLSEFRHSAASVFGFSARTCNVRAIMIRVNNFECDADKP